MKTLIYKTLNIHVPVCLLAKGVIMTYIQLSTTCMAVRIIADTWDKFKEL
jgi:hypothetical protein